MPGNLGLESLFFLSIYFVYHIAEIHLFNLTELTYREWTLKIVENRIVHIQLFENGVCNYSFNEKICFQNRLQIA